MNHFEEDLGASVSATASFSAADVGARVARRRRHRRVVTVLGAALALAVVAGSAYVALSGDDGPDLEAVDDPPTTGSTLPDQPGELRPVAEDPVGADGATGALTDLHVETTDTFGFVECDSLGEPGPPDDARAAELEAVIESLRGAGLHDQPFVVSSGGPQSIWGVPSIGLSSRYEPSLRWIADRVDAGDVCVEFPQFGLRNLPPELAEVSLDAGGTADGVVAVVAVGCEPKGEWVAPFIRDRDGSVEVGIAIGRGQLVFTDDCPVPTVHMFDVSGEAPVSVADRPGTLEFPDGAVAPGDTAAFTFDPVNVVSGTTIGDDLIAQHVDDPTVQFQVSDLFGGSPVAGAVGEVATDQWPVTGAGRISVPDGVPAGTYHVRLIASPELNGVLEVGGEAGAGGDAASSMPDSGWFVPDLDGDGERDVVDGRNGQVLLVSSDGVTPLVDPGGVAISVPIEGDEVFTCDSSASSIYVEWDDEIGDELARRGMLLDVADGVASWLPSTSFFHTDWELPAVGRGCEPFA